MRKTSSALQKNSTASYSSSSTRVNSEQELDPSFPSHTRIAQDKKSATTETMMYCSRCGSFEVEQKYCLTCGANLNDNPTSERIFIANFAPTSLSIQPNINLAAASDRGFRHLHNEDAVAIASGVFQNNPWHVLVVCDGVSTSSYAQFASKEAARVACTTLCNFARSEQLRPDILSSAIVMAVQHAHEAVCREVQFFAEQYLLSQHSTSQVVTHSSDLPPPGTTIVIAMIYQNTASIGWVGDSRAYWLTNDQATLLTRDHSWLNEALARGEKLSDDMLSSSMAHALTRCIGPLENNGDQLVIPDVVHFELNEPGHLILCSDGLWNYAASTQEMHALFQSIYSLKTIRLRAHSFIEYALKGGGHDNISVALYEHQNKK